MSDSTILSFDSTAESLVPGHSSDSDVSNSSATSSSSFSASAASNSSAASNLSAEPNSSAASNLSAASNSSVEAANSSLETNLSLESSSSLEHHSYSEHHSSLESNSPSASNITDTSADGSNILQSTQEDSSLNMIHDESHSLVNLSVPDDDVPSQIRSLSRNMADFEAELDGINRYCNRVVQNVINITPTSTSTPTVVRGNRRRSDITPVEVIDLSHLEFVPPIRSARNRAPDAVIDLCTPDGARRRLETHTNDSPTIHNRRPVLARRIENSPVVDLDDVSPPKRAHRDPELSQREDAYKCPVCMEGVRDREPVSTKCGHVFCRECIQTAISSTHKCPMCNKKLTARQYNRIYL
nr:uncharacterized protein LOC108014373 [Drosophila suzukii]